MKSLSRILLGCLILVAGVVPATHAAGIKNKDDFLAAIKNAFATKAPAKLMELTYTEGMSAEDKAQVMEGYQMVTRMGGEIESASFGPLQKDFRPVHVMAGKRIESLRPPDGSVILKLKGTNDGNSEVPYTIVDGVYYIDCVKSTSLPWKGPADVSLSIQIAGAKMGKIKVHVKYNASGVDLEDDYFAPSISFFGQNILEVVVTNGDVTDNLQLIIQRDGKIVYQSEKVKGPTLNYKKE